MHRIPFPSWLSTLLVLLLLPLTTFSQGNELSLEQINLDRLQLTRGGMLVLGSWAVGNMAFSGVQTFRTTGSTRHFHQMNVWWNAVNLGIATFGYLGAGAGQAEGLNLAASLSEQNKLEKMLLFNAGLDAGYIMTGAFLRERSLNASAKWQPRLRGWGNSLLLQGGFLMAFDLGFFFVLNHHGNQGIHRLLETVQIGPGSLSLTF